MLYADCMSQRGLASCLHQWKHDIYILVHCLYRTPKFARTILHTEWAMRTHPLYSRGTRVSTHNQ